MRAFLDWLIFPTDHPGRSRNYHRLNGIFGALPAAEWLLTMVPFVYSVLVRFVALAVLVAWIP